MSEIIKSFIGENIQIVMIGAIFLMIIAIGKIKT
jgi:hypothetical protein